MVLIIKMWDSIYEEFDNLDQLDGANDDSDTEPKSNEGTSADTKWKKVLNLRHSRKRRFDYDQAENVEQELSNASRQVRNSAIRRVRNSTDLDLAPSPLDPEDIFGIRGPFHTRFNVLDSQNQVSDETLMNTQVSRNEPELSSHASNEMSIDLNGELHPEYLLVDLAETQNHPAKSQSEMAIDIIDKGANTSTQKSEISERSRRSIVSEEGEAFTARLNKMWSPKSSEDEAMAFRLYPPNATSPTLSKQDSHKASQATQLSEALSYGLQLDTQGPVNTEYTPLTYTMPPPNVNPNNYPSVVYQEPFFSDKKDAPRRPKIYAGREFRLKTLEPSNYEEMAVSGTDIVRLNDTKLSNIKGKRVQEKCTIRSWTPASIPPTAHQANKWLEKEKLRKAKKAAKIEQKRESHSANKSSSDSGHTPTKKAQVYTQVSFQLGEGI